MPIYFKYNNGPNNLQKGRFKAMKNTEYVVPSRQKGCCQESGPLPEKRDLKMSARRISYRVPPVCLPHSLYQVAVYKPLSMLYSGKLALVAIDFCNFVISAAVTRTSSGHIQNWWEKPHHSEILAFELIVITEWNFEFSLLGKEGVCSIR